MTVRRLPLRLVVGVASGALLAGSVGAVSLLGTAQAAGCPIWTDPAGDASTGQLPNDAGVIGDDNLDIVSAGFSATATTVTATFKVVKLAETASDLGDRFHLDFTVNGKNLQIYSIRDAVGLVGDEAGFANATDGTTAAGKAKAAYDVAKSTVTITGLIADLATVATVPVAGKAVSALVANSQDYLAPVGEGLPYDDAPTKLTAGLAPNCVGAAAAPSASATPSPTATASPTPTPSATPTASPSPSPSPVKAADGTFVLPRKNCAQVTDPAEDADPTGLGAFNEPSLDITQLNLKSPAGQLLTYIKVTDIDAALAPLWSGRLYESSFTINAKKVVLQAPGDGVATATVAGTANTDIKATAKIDTAANTIVFTVPLDGLSKAVGTTVQTGTAITDPGAATYAQSQLGDQPADSAVGTTAAQKTYTYGDNTCFLPPVAKITLQGASGAQYRDIRTFTATLKDVDGAAVTDARLVASLTGGRAYAAITNKDGAATFRLPLLVPSGTKTLTVTFAGSDFAQRTVTKQSFVVSVERTVLRPASISRGFQVSLVDDDRPTARPVAGRYVVFTVGTRNYTVRTSTTGVARLTGLAKGKAVRVTFLGVSRLYAPAKSVSGRAG